MSTVDLAIEKNADGHYDLSIGPTGDLSLTEGLDTAIKMSIFCERRASGDEMPDVLRRRGWIGNTLSDTLGFEIGSKLWLYYQSKRTNTTLAGVKNAVENGLSWLLEDGLVSNITATTAPSSAGVEITVTLFYSNDIIQFKFYTMLSNTGL